MKIAQLGTVPPPPWLARIGGNIGGLQILANILFRSLIALAGIYTVFNLILAGYADISAGGEPKRIQDATAKIWQSVLGLAVAAGAFLLAAIIGEVLFGDPNMIIQLQYFTP